MVTAQRAIPTVVGKLATLASIAAAFTLALVATIYLSLRSPEVKVPEVTGKSQTEAESLLAEAGLNVRTRARRYSAEVKPDTVLDQAPRSGEMVKSGQTVAIVVSRAEAKAGESSVGIKREEENKNEPLLSRYPQINGYPHLFVLERDGHFLHSQDTGQLEEGKSYNLAKFMAFLKEWSPPENRSASH